MTSFSLSFLYELSLFLEIQKVRRLHVVEANFGPQVPQEAVVDTHVRVPFILSLKCIIHQSAREIFHVK